jgi:hypothetical protein
MNQLGFATHNFKKVFRLCLQFSLILLFISFIVNCQSDRISKTNTTIKNIEKPATGNKVPSQVGLTGHDSDWVFWQSAKNVLTATTKKGIRIAFGKKSISKDQIASMVDGIVDEIPNEYRPYLSHIVAGGEKNINGISVLNFKFAAKMVIDKPSYINTLNIVCSKIHLELLKQFGIKDCIFSTFSPYNEDGRDAHSTIAHFSNKENRSTLMTIDNEKDSTMYSVYSIKLTNGTIKLDTIK